jgi:hypothetical protein
LVVLGIDLVVLGIYLVVLGIGVVVLGIDWVVLGMDLGVLGINMVALRALPLRVWITAIQKTFLYSGAYDLYKTTHRKHQNRLMFC